MTNKGFEDGSAPGSFRDPSGFVFRKGGVVYRQVNQVYQAHYDLLMGSGLYKALAGGGLLVAHEEVRETSQRPEGAYKVIRPEEIPFISYPYEWCFSQLKDAALATLAIQDIALAHGMVLKDASAYNIQFVDGRPVFIDTLSFETYGEGRPWVAYRQFCQHFLAPLALMHYRDVRLAQLLRVYIDGVPLDLAKRLLPPRTRLNFGLLTHLHLHAASQAKHAGDAGAAATKAAKARVARGKVSRTGLLGIVDSLRGTIKKLEWTPAGTEWGDYYADTNYSDDALTAKRELVAKFLERIQPASVWDLGANTGMFSRIASARGCATVAFDMDPAAVEKNYRQCRAKEEKGLLPLLMDLTNPSPGIGWNNEERESLLARGPVDAAMALALVHHLALSNNVPLNRIADFFACACKALIIEFVPKEDSQVQRLLASREDVFTDYYQAPFETAFLRRFTIEAAAPVMGSRRVLYLMRRK